MEFTGERFLPQISGRIAYEHFHRYAVAVKHAEGCDVLDAACGEGYGSAMLARVAKTVTGIDIDKRTIDTAAAKYFDVPGISFRRADCIELPFADASFDLVVSFETIEHVPDPESLVGELSRVLRPGGLLIISSPNRPVYTEQSGQVNPFHLKEYDVPEFRQVLGSRFQTVKMFGQRLSAVSIISYLRGDDRRETLPAVKSFVRSKGTISETASPVDEPTYLLAFCLKSAAPTKVCLDASTYWDVDDDIWKKQDAILLWASGVDAELTQMREAKAVACKELDKVRQELSACQEALDLANAMGDRRQRMLELLKEEATLLLPRANGLAEQNAMLRQQLYEADEALRHERQQSASAHVSGRDKLERALEENAVLLRRTSVTGG